ncbi:MAG: hypothetical protein RL414_291 [Actinomycetota bacterium]|jgi:glycosyltransferase involved in cell wall biosynthesis
MEFVLALAAIAAFTTLLNIATMRNVKPSPLHTISSSVSVLVPMRNEIANVDDLVSSIQASRGLTHWDFRVLDDASTDGTGEALATKYLTLVDHTPLPEGWLGKNWACNQLALSTEADYLVFVDADVRLHPDAIASSLALMDSLQWDFISPYPRQIAITFLERLIQPLLQWSWMSSVPLRLAEKLGITSMTIANGQFLIVKRSAYTAIGGHEAIKGEVLDDLRLARTLVADGYRGGVADGSAVASCRMYESGKDLVNGYTKSLWKAFGGFFGTVVTVALLLATHILPLLLGCAGYALGWISFMLVAFSHGAAALKTKSAPTNVFVHPISILVLLALIVESIRRKVRGELVWRGRRVN